MRDDVQQKKISTLAGEVLTLSHDDILVQLRFFDVALARLTLQEREGIMCIATDGNTLFYDPVYVLKTYKEAPKYINRLYLHLLLHCIFSHSFQYDKLDTEIWDMAADIAVENVILELSVESTLFDEDEDLRRKLKVLKEDAGGLTAEKIYRYFKNNPPSDREKKEYRKLTCKDVHTLWRPAEEIQLNLEDWKKISERIRADLKSFTKSRQGGETLSKNLDESTRDKYDYSDILRRFSVMGENITVNDDEFDYIYYTYGLSTYGNLPLIEPLEYKEEHRVREFVIALDTSASCRGEIVKNFLKKTYSILKSSENFFKKINVHIIQCDSEIQSDTKITEDAEFDDFVKYGKLTGFGGTDFRPVFDYVESLKEQGEFEKLKGLIYFTDGYGVYPERMPDYDVIFAFLNEDNDRAPVPPWSLKVILDEEEFEKADKQGAN